MNRSASLRVIRGLKMIRVFRVVRGLKKMIRVFRVFRGP
jgi:hypothetical protein